MISDAVIEDAGRRLVVVSEDEASRRGRVPSALVHCALREGRLLVTG